MKTYTDVYTKHLVYALNSIPRKSHPLAILCSHNLLRVNKTIHEEILSIVRRHDLDFQVVDIQRPANLKTRIVKQKDEQPP